MSLDQAKDLLRRYRNGEVVGVSSAEWAEALEVALKELNKLHWD